MQFLREAPTEKFKGANFLQNPASQLSMETIRISKFNASNTVSKKRTLNEYEKLINERCGFATDIRKVYLKDS